MINKISLLIPTMNRPNSLRSTLESYFTSNVVPDQIVVVDQSQCQKAQNENREVLSKFQDRADCVYIRQLTPSITEARNRAFAASKYDIVICSDDDVEIYSDTLENVRDIMKDPQIAMIAGIDDNSRISHNLGGYILGTKSFFKRKMGHVTRSMLGRYPTHVNGQVMTEWAMGYFFVIRGSLVRKLGVSWDEKLTSYAYAEDLDFSYTLFKKATFMGYHCILSDKVRVKHLGSLEYRVPSRKSTFMYVINRYYIAYKHGCNDLTIASVDWVDFWMVIFRLIKRQNAGELISAMIRAKKVQTKLKLGEIDPSFYE